MGAISKKNENLNPKYNNTVDNKKKSYPVTYIESIIPLEKKKSSPFHIGYTIIKNNSDFHDIFLAPKILYDDLIDIEEITLEQSENALREIEKTFEEISSTGDDSMDEFHNKLDELSKDISSVKTDIAVINERLSKMDQMFNIIDAMNNKILTENDVKQLTSDVLKSNDVATKDYVGNKIDKVKLWVIATAGGVALIIIQKIWPFFVNN